MRHRKPKPRWRSRLVVVGLLPVAFLVTWDVPLQETAPPPRGKAAAGAGGGAAAPRPEIVSRSGWHADEEMVRDRAPSLGQVRTVFVHHTSQPNDYDCADVPRMLRMLENDHVQRGWDDLGYNFIVDRCGTVYEGRSGGLSRSVEGAHTKGFNANSLGIAAVGTFPEGQEVPGKMLDAIAAVAAWKLRPGADPAGRTRMTSSSDESRYDKGEKPELDVISGHRDAYETDCPGPALYDRLGDIRKKAKQIRDAAARDQDQPATEATEAAGRPAR